MSNLLDNVPVFCVVCGGAVPLDRKKRRSVTCSEACALKRNNYLREKKDMRKCKYCANPTSFEEREDFKAWRRDRNAAKRAEAKAAKEGPVN